MNFAVYDYGTGSVIDTACIDSSPVELQRFSCGFGAVIDGSNVTFELDNIWDSFGDIEYGRVSARGLLWDANSKEPLEFDFVYDNDKVYRASLNAKKIDYSDCYVEIYVTDDKIKIEGKAVDWHGDLFFARNDAVEYLNLVKENLDGRAVFMTAKKGASDNISDEVLEALNGLGLTAISGRDESYSYYAALTDEGVAEEYGPEALSYNGVVADYQSGDLDIPYELYSAGWNHGNCASIRIGGREHSVNEDGINIVIYNYKTGKVEDAVAFDTRAKKTGSTR